MTIARHVKHASLALIALSSVGVLQGAYANGTPSNTDINNQATVDYSVGGVPQTQISSPVATFKVDARIDLDVEQLSGPILTQPGQTNVMAMFRVINTGNSTQGYRLTVVNDPTGTAGLAGNDNQDVTNIRVFVDSNNNGTYEAGTDTAANVDSLATDSNGEEVRVFVLADIPLTATNNQFANLRLTARAAVPGSNGANLVTETVGADNPLAVDVVFADTGRDATDADANQYQIQSAALTLNKTVTVVSDDFNGTTNPKAIPNAIVQYTITVTNNSTTTPAGAVTVTDNIPANTTYVPGTIQLNGGGVADGTAFQNGPPARVVVNAGAVNQNGGTAIVTFRVRINN